jgi:transposase
MFVRVKTKPNGSQSVQIVESLRFRDRVSQQIVQHIGIAKNEDELDELKRLANEILKQLKYERNTSPGQRELFSDNEETDSAPYDSGTERVLEEEDDVRLVSLVNENRVIDGPFEVVEWIFRNMGLDGIFTNKKRDGARVKTLKQCIAGMIASPGSKMGLSSWLAKYYADSVSLDSIYRFMDDFYKKKRHVTSLVRRNSESLAGDRVKLMLYDVTTLYFESFEEDELRQCGYSKDSKFKETQVVLALATTPEGMPLWYETYPGKTWEGNTFKEFVQKWRTDSPSGTEGVVVADCGMFSSCNLEELRENGLHYALGAPLKKLPDSEKQAALNLAEYKEILDESGEEEAKLKYLVIRREDGSNVLSTWSEKRARKNAFDRQKLIERVLKKMNKSSRGRGKIKADELVGNRGTKKYIKLSEGQEQNTYVLDEEKIEQDSRWDGLRGIITDLPLGSEREVRDVLSHYGSLWRIEESFRINKTDLKIRPIYHWTKRRVEAHILLCYLVFACLRYLERRTQMQQHFRMSPGKLREAILDVDSSIFKDPERGTLYRIPRQLTPLAQKLYRSLGIRRDTKPRELLNMSAYYKLARFTDKVLRTEG